MPSNDYSKTFFLRMKKEKLLDTATKMGLTNEQSVTVFRKMADKLTKNQLMEWIETRLSDLRDAELADLFGRLNLKPNKKRTTATGLGPGSPAVRSLLTSSQGPETDDLVTSLVPYEPLPEVPLLMSDFLSQPTITAPDIPITPPMQFQDEAPRRVTFDPALGSITPSIVDVPPPPPPPVRPRSPRRGGTIIPPPAIPPLTLDIQDPPPPPSNLRRDVIPPPAVPPLTVPTCGRDVIPPPAVPPLATRGRDVIPPPAVPPLTVPTRGRDVIPPPAVPPPSKTRQDVIPPPAVPPQTTRATLGADAATRIVDQIVPVVQPKKSCLRMPDPPADIATIPPPIDFASTSKFRFPKPSDSEPFGVPSQPVVLTQPSTAQPQWGAPSLFDIEPPSPVQPPPTASVAPTAPKKKRDNDLRVQIHNAKDLADILKTITDPNHVHISTVSQVEYQTCKMLGLYY
jgi:hypothetical protein